MGSLRCQFWWTKIFRNIYYTCRFGLINFVLLKLHKLNHPNNFPLALFYPMEKGSSAAVGEL